MITYWYVAQNGSTYRWYQSVDEQVLPPGSSIPVLREWMADQLRLFPAKETQGLQSILIEAKQGDFAYPKPLWWRNLSNGKDLAQGLLDVEVKHQFHTVFFWHDFLNYINTSKKHSFAVEDPNTELRRMITTNDFFSHFKRRIFALNNKKRVQPYFSDDFSYRKNVFYKKDNEVPSGVIGLADAPWSPWSLPVVLPRETCFQQRPSLDIEIAASIIRLYYYASTMDTLDFDIQYIPRQEWCNIVSSKEERSSKYQKALHAWSSFRPDAFEFLRERRLLKSGYDVGLSKQVIKL
jgi:hypothetical protein